MDSRRWATLSPSSLWASSSNSHAPYAEAFTTLPEYERALQEEDAKNFVPPGKIVHSYDTAGRKYEIWAGSLADPAVRHLLDRMQVFVSFFIEAGTPLATDDPEWTLERWTVYFVYVASCRLCAADSTRTDADQIF